jgi:hypothetical protein
MNLSKIQEMLKSNRIECIFNNKGLFITARTKNTIERTLLLFDIIKSRGYTIDDNSLHPAIISPDGMSFGILNLEKLEEEEQDIVNEFEHRFVREPQDRYVQLIKNYNTHKKSKQGLPDIRLPQLDYPVSKFAKNLSLVFKGNETIFYRERENELVEIKEHYDELLRKKLTAFKRVDATRLLNLIEELCSTYIYNDKGIAKGKSASEQQIKMIMKNTNFLEAIYKVDRFLQYPMPFMMQGKLELPEKGYNQKFQAYLTKDSPNIEEMDIDTAKKILLDILQDFCFEKETDKIMAISYLITPACRGLYSSITDRTPIFLITANRERAGKDYLAGVQGILYEGKATDDPAIVTGDRDQNNDELRKKFTSALKMGRRRYHSANNKGWINNAILEGFVTSKIWQDRELGGNNMLELNNEMDISLSANIGISYTPDFWYRCRKINLFFADEDPNARVFSKPNLHQYVIDNRSSILSAIFALIKSWVEAGQPSDSVFSSFPEWARVVGGIMKYHDLGDPCMKIEDAAIGGDTEGQNMKQLYDNMYEIQTNTINKSHTLSEIMNIVNSKKEDWGAFTNYDFERPSDRTKFGLSFRKWIGRISNNIIMKVDDVNQRAARQKFSFDKVKIETGNVGNVGNVCQPHLCFGNEEVKYIGDCKTLPSLPTLPNFSPQESTIIRYLYNNKYTNREMLEIMVSSEVVDKLLNLGVIMEAKPDKICLTNPEMCIDCEVMK